MKTIIAGCRNFNDNLLLRKRLDYYTEHNGAITEVVSGGAAGVDTIGEWYALMNGIPVRQFKADWNKLGKKAGPIRNRQMAEYADVLLAVWDGKSRGTKNMIDEMNKLKKPVFIVWIGESFVANTTAVE
ncbi:Mycobacteriophage D29, Gp61 [uncultured Caudovirales phage]|uniref:Mycobacteriophage D29, Gp61 n=1 Tax=uncultured Caudovirales phage TaxID=2100421 RepID=A0A6J7WW64_9CAUD|nr:Mycobacteriophage D29, Gp61 [uncultured Caudovirales phage]